MKGYLNYPRCHLCQPPLPLPQVPRRPNDLAGQAPLRLPRADAGVQHLSPCLQHLRRKEKEIAPPPITALTWGMGRVYWGMMSVAEKEKARYT